MKRISLAFVVALATATSLITGCDFLDRLKSGDEAQLRIECAPTGAVLIVSGKPRGELPMTLVGLKSGRMVLTARKDGYHDARLGVNLAAGDRKTVKMELSELTGLVLVRSVPPDSDVTLDGAFRGKTPLLVADFPSGTHRLKIARPGFFAKDVEVTVKDRAPQLVSLDLTSDAAALSVNSEPVGATVLVNGANHGTTPCKIEALPSGDVQVEVRMEGYATFQQTVKLAAGQSFQVSANLTARPGDLAIVTTPDHAKVYVDNQLRGDAPVTLLGQPPGAHRVRVELKGFETEARDVTVKAGDKVTEEFRLVQNSGVLMLITEPGSVRVLIDGEVQGETKPAPAGLVSQPFEVNLLSPGEHSLQLVRPGWSYQPTKFTIENGKAATLREKLSRLYIPDIEVRTHDDIIRGVLLREYASGDLEIERQPGVIVRVQAIDIVERKAIKQGEK